MVQGPNEMQPASAARPKLTYQDYLAFPDDGLRHELIDGEHHVTPAPGIRHQVLSARLVTALGMYLRQHRVGQVMAAPTDVALSEFDIVQPDVLFVSNEHFDMLKQSLHHAPDLAVEILSPSTRATDEGEKRLAYERFGVREYWIVDPEFDRVTVYRRDSRGLFQVAARLGGQVHEPLTTPLLPGFSLELDELFA
jgi:Uma2 family endonuclease